MRDPFDAYDTRPGGTDLRKCARRAGAPESPATAAATKENGMVQVHNCQCALHPVQVQRPKRPTGRNQRPINTDRSELKGW